MNHTAMSRFLGAKNSRGVQTSSRNILSMSFFLNGRFQPTVERALVAETSWFIAAVCLADSSAAAVGSLLSVSACQAWG